MRLSDSFVSLIKGGLIGIASIIPGLAPASISVSLSIYNDIVTGIKKIFKKENRRFSLVIIPIIIGLLAGLFGGQKLINFALNNYQTQTIFLFIGLIAGGYKLKIKKILSQKNKSTFKNGAFFLITFISIILIQILIIDQIALDIKNSYINTALFGFISGIILFIPGLNLTSNIVLKENFSILLGNFLSIIIFIITLTISVIIICNIIYQIINKKQEIFNLITSALLTATIVIVLLQIREFTFSFVNIFTTILAFLWGYILAKNLENE